MSVWLPKWMSAMRSAQTDVSERMSSVTVVGSWVQMEGGTRAMMVSRVLLRVAVVLVASTDEMVGMVEMVGIVAVLASVLDLIGAVAAVVVVGGIVMVDMVGRRPLGVIGVLVE